MSGNNEKYCFGKIGNVYIQYIFGKIPDHKWDAALKDSREIFSSHNKKIAIAYVDLTIGGQPKGKQILELSKLWMENRQNLINMKSFIIATNSIVAKAFFDIVSGPVGMLVDVAAYRSSDIKNTHKQVVEHIKLRDPRNQMSKNMFDMQIERFINAKE